MVDHRVLVIVPAWNEAKSLPNVVSAVRDAVPDADILIVDDGSLDDTYNAAMALSVRAARLPYNLGVGGAMRLGFRVAQQDGYDVAVQVDADGQHDPTYIASLLKATDDADLVIGARFAGVGDYQMRGPRRWAIRMLSLVLSRLAGTRLTDPTSGFRACTRPLIELFARQYPMEYLGDTVESLTFVLRAGYRVRQVPVAMRRRAIGSPSQSPLRATLYLGRAAVVLLLALIRR